MLKVPAVLDGVEPGDAPGRDDGAWLSVVACPAAEPCQEPRGIANVPSGCGFFCREVLPFEAPAVALQGGRIVWIKDIAEGVQGLALAFAHKLHHRDGAARARGRCNRLVRTETRPGSKCHRTPRGY